MNHDMDSGAITFSFADAPSFLDATSNLNTSNLSTVPLCPTDSTSFSDATMASPLNSSDATSSPLNFLDTTSHLDSTSAFEREKSYSIDESKSYCKKLIMAKDMLQLEEIKKDHLAKVIYSAPDTTSIFEPIHVNQLYEKNGAPIPHYILTYDDNGRDVTLLKPGGLLSVIGNAGSGKTAFISCLAVSMETGDPNIDTFGFHLHLPPGKIAVIIDVELDEEECCLNYERMIKRAGISQLKRVELHCAYKGSAEEQYNHLIATLNRPEVGVVILDGIGNMIPDVNNLVESRKLVMGLLRIVKSLNKTFICTIHDNLQSSKNALGGKAQGHLGSALTQFFNTMLCVKHDGEGVYSVSLDGVSGKCRTSDRNWRSLFRWDRDLCRHVSINRKVTEEICINYEHIMPLLDRKHDREAVIDLLVKRGKSRDAAKKEYLKLKNDGDIVLREDGIVEIADHLRAILYAGSQLEKSWIK